MNFKHGLSKTNRLEYHRWNNMHLRCYDHKNQDWHSYGGRGIQVCARWHKSNPNGFPNFLHDMGRIQTGKTIDRINGNLSYMPSNCRWATTAEQSANRRCSLENRLSRDELQLIANLYGSGQGTARSLGKRFRIAHGSVYNIWRQWT